MLTMYEQITIQTLHKQGVKQSQIAEQVGCHRNTVKNVIDRMTLLEKQTRKKSSVFDPYKEKIKELRDKDVTKLRIHEILRDDYGVHSTYDNLRKYVRNHIPKPVKAFGVQQTNPGEDVELDFGYLGMLPGMSGKLVRTYGFVAVLAYSRVGYYGICYNQRLETLIKELQEAFTYFGGVPKRMKVDNMRTAILKNLKYDLLFNQGFLEFAHHYNTVIIPCEPYSPEQKGKVESGVKYMQQNFVSGRTFTDTADVKAKLKDWMHTHANQRIHGTTKRVPWVELLEKERVTLQPLPTEEFALFNRCVRKVGINCHIHFENNYYSVPFQFVGQEATIRFNDNLVRIIVDGEQVAFHTRSTDIGQYITNRVHLPEHKIYSETERQVKTEAKMQEIGDAAHEYFRYLLQNKQGYWSKIVRGILGLCEKYGSDAVNLSLKRALHYGVTELVIIKNIVEKKLYLEDLEPVLPKIEEETPIMGRDLTYYTPSYDTNAFSNTA